MSKKLKMKQMLYSKSAVKDFFKDKIFKPEYERQGLLKNVFTLIKENIPWIKPITYLDVGFGEGDLTKQVASYYNLDSSNVHGIEVSDYYVNNTGKNIIAKKVDLETSSLPFKDQYFDIVICNQVLEHIKNYSQVLNEIIRVTQQGGYIIVGIPNLSHLINRLILLLGYQPICIGVNSTHVRGFTHKAFLKLIFQNENLKMINCTGSIMYPFPYFLSEKLSSIFIGLSGYTCYLIQKIH